MKKAFFNNKYLVLIALIIPFLLIDLFFRYFTIKSIYFYSIRNIAPVFFCLSIISFNLLIVSCLPKKLGVVYYILITIINTFFGIVNYFHYKVLGSFFTFSEIFLVGEGLEFKSVLLSYISFKLILAVVMIFVLEIIATIVLIKSNDSYSRRKLAIFVVLFQIVGIIFLLVNNNGYDKKSSYSPIYNYLNFETPHRSIEVVGVLQYNVQDIIMYYKNLIKEKMEYKRYSKRIKEYFDSKSCENEQNEYTSIFEGKNLIYIMVETGDDWLLTEEDMPTFYRLKNEGLNFTNRYAPIFYAGYTINSEFAANTSYYLVDGFNDYLNNYFPYSLPYLFKEKDYIVNSFHMNRGDFYNRSTLHKSLGYDNYYGDYNTSEYKNKGYDYVNDISWIDNDETYELLVPKSDKNFMSFLITYSMHLPFFNNSLCEQAIRAKEIEYTPWEKREEICLRYLARQTDEMVNRLIKRLDDDGLLEDTVLVLFADHSAYGFSDKKYLAKVKKTDNLYLQQKIPLIIWGSDIGHEDIDILMDTADLVPTLANMFGLDYDCKNYLSTDVFSKEHDDYVYFSSGFVLDSDNNFIDNGLSKKGIEMINFNKYILKTNYFREG